MVRSSYEYMSYLQVVQVFSSIPRWSIFGRSQHAHDPLVESSSHSRPTIQNLFSSSWVLEMVGAQGHHQRVAMALSAQRLYRRAFVDHARIVQ